MIYLNEYFIVIWEYCSMLSCGTLAPST